MKRILMLIALSALFIACGSSKSIQSSGAGTAIAGQAISSDSTQYIPIEGRAEAGTVADIEGTWELLSINGLAVSDGLKAVIRDSAKNLTVGTEFRRDSITTIDTAGGVKRTFTEINYDRTGTTEKRITPPQGSNYHIPEKPRISFFGSNETFSGFTGCNKMAGRYKTTGKDSISLQNATASTKMVCIGEFNEESFLTTLRRVTTFKSGNGQLQLMDGDKVLLVFTRK